MPDIRTIPDDALPPCCVRIDVGGAHAGSGFFVAPGVVVTCFHVVKSERLSSGEADPGISVVTAAGTPYTVLDLRECSPTDEDDLAVLRVAPREDDSREDIDHPFVLLDTGLRARDDLHSFGFPEGHPEGEPTPLTAAGWMRDDRWLKLVEGRVRPGMSGSPVLNLRTGAVCGVLKRTAGVGHALGGYAVSIRGLFALSPMLESINFRHHTTHRRAWFDLLPADEQRHLLVQRAPVGPTSAPHAVFVLSVGQAKDAWKVTATVHRPDRDGGWSADGTIASREVDLNSVRALVARLFRDWASREATVRGRVEPGEQIRLLGEILSSAILRDAVGVSFDELLQEVRHGWIEVALHFDDADADTEFRDFVELPWEHLYLPARRPRADLYFAREPRLAFVRTLEAAPVAQRHGSGKLSVLVLTAKPPTYAHRPTEDSRAELEISTIVAGLQQLAASLAEVLEVTVVECSGIDALMEVVEPRTHDVLHYVGFGKFDEGSDRIALSTASPSEARYVNANDFATCLEGSVPRLAVLQACRGAESVPADLAVFAPPLLMGGADAVVAEQYPVAGDLTRKFNAALYTALAEGVPLEPAAQRARKKVWSGDSESRAFLSPAVFVRNPGGLLLAERRDAGVRSRLGALSSHA